MIFKNLITKKFLTQASVAGALLTMIFTIVSNLTDDGIKYHEDKAQQAKIISEANKQNLLLLQDSIQKSFDSITYYGSSVNNASKQQDEYECKNLSKPYTGGPCSLSPPNRTEKMFFGDAFFRGQIDNYHKYQSAVNDSITDVSNLELYNDKNYKIFVDSYKKWAHQHQSDSVLPIQAYIEWQTLFNMLFKISEGNQR